MQVARATLSRLRMRQDRTPERRKSHRFPIECEVRFQTTDKRREPVTGCGKTVNISSSGVLFVSEEEVPTGTRLELSIKWPIPLDKHCFLSFVVHGRVVRQDSNGYLALDIQSYEFRTRTEGAQTTRVKAASA